MNTITLDQWDGFFTAREMSRNREDMQRHLRTIPVDCREHLAQLQRKDGKYRWFCPTCKLTTIIR